MLLTPNISLENLLVELMAKRPSATAATLLDQLQGSGHSYSIQAIYKELRKLQSQGVVLKRNGEYSLHLSWILNLLSLADKMFDTQTGPGATASVLPAEGEKKNYRFGKLSHVDDFWIHALLVILQNSTARTLYQWLPHPWFHLINSHKSFPLHQAFEAGGYVVQCIVGGDTYLDRYSKQITTPGVYDFYYAEGPFANQNSVYYSATDSYLITVKPDKASSSRIDQIYKQVQSKQDYKELEVVSTLSLPGRISVSIECRTANVTRVWGKFRRYFEV